MQRYLQLSAFLKPLAARALSGSHAVEELSEADKERLMLYKDKSFTRTTHFPVEDYLDLKVTQQKESIKLHTYKHPAQGTPKAVLAVLYVLHV